MDLPGTLYEPSRLAQVCWDLLWPAVYLGTLSTACSLLGRLFASRKIVSRVPTFARVLPIIGTVLLGLPVISWGIHAIVILEAWGKVVFTGHGDPSLFPAYFLMVPISGLGAILVDRGCAFANASRQRTGHIRDAITLATVSTCWAFVMVVVAFRWEA